MPKIVLCVISVFLLGHAFSQTSTVKGRIVDTSVNKGLAYATVSLVNAGDSTLVTFSRADSSGWFRFSNIEKGSYLISASYVGYGPVWHPVKVTGNMATQDIGLVHLINIARLANVTVADKRPPVTINNDTLEFNTENFKTQPNAVVEEMLKKMPGVTIDNDGTIKVNGQTVRRVLVNGKEFFTGDPRMATKNLSADAVDKVQVFDKKSDQAEFTGIDDGNQQKTINLKLKKDKANALFGRVTAGAGPKRYDAQANLNRFNGDEQLSFIGMGNNTNRQGFSMQDALNFSGELSRGMRNGGGVVIRTGGDDNNNGLPVTGLGQNQQGIAKTFAGGVNYSNAWNNRRSDFNMSYTASDINLQTNKQTFTQNLSPQNPFNRVDSSNSVKEVTQHRINLMLDQKLDTFTSLKITPSVTFQDNRSVNNSLYQSVNEKSVLLNNGYSNTSTDASAFNFTSDMLLRRRFAKKGRTVSANISLGYNNSKSAGAQHSLNTFYDVAQNPADSLINQRNNRDAVTKNFGANMVYTEPLGKHALLEASAYYNINKGESDKQTFNFNNGSNKYDRLDSLLSNSFSSRYAYTGGGLRLRSNKNKTSFSVGAQVQYAILNSYNNTTGNNIRQSFNDVLPGFNYQYQISRTKNLRVDYSTYTTQPSVMQLQPVADISDPLNISIGNALLRRQYNHNMSINYFGANMATRKNLMLFFSGTISKSAIVYSDELAPNGSRVTRPVNADGVYSIISNINYGFPLKKLKSRLELELTTTYNNNISFINANRNTIKNFSAGPRINYNFDIDTTISLQFTARLTYNSTQYTLQPLFNNKYFQQSYAVDMTNFLPAGFTVNNQFTYTINTGRTSGFNARVPLWNVSLARGFMKNKRAEVKLAVMDVLNKNIGITRSVNQNYITDQKYNVLNRYFLLSFTYGLNKSGLQGGPRAVIRMIGG
ncbi:TonB-dependent receptor [Foetidibacter luteolus]|uniref:TonB-dependent receptor n=1 Tax=Foetidibacter luteolus TaxID=2608880 RepID=UPI00129AECC5|nr:TonB-dependent receptor [Foetidibacter luteolus]